MSTEFLLAITIPDTHGIVWGELWCGRECREFQFSAQTVNTMAKKMRKDARAWADKYKRRDVTASSALEDLRQLGIDCFTELFRTANPPMHEFLAAAEGDASIVVRLHSPAVQVPWGLLCDPTSNDPFPFWGIKYNLAIYSIGRQGDPNPHSWFFASAFHDDTFADVYTSLHAAEQPLAKEIHARRILVEKFRPRMQPPKDAPTCCFVYVHAHGEEGLLVFPKEEGGPWKIAPHNLLDAVLQRDGVAFIMLNACYTEQSIPNFAECLMLPSTNREIACIVTEYPVDNEFAMRVGLELIDRCVQRGENTIEAMKAIRRRHYPMSIVYALYSKRACGFTVIPTLPLINDSLTDQYRKLISTVNFSDK